MKKITLICVYNDKTQLDEMLLASIDKLSASSSIMGGGNKILIDNTLNKYRSCASAYNAALKQNQGNQDDILIFLHQDIAFDDADFLQRIVNELSVNPRQLLGFAGMPKDGHTISNLRYFRTKDFITRTHLNDKREVESLDECCFAMTRGVYEEIKFDEDACNGWHLYAVDFCYNAHYLHNIPSYVLPETIYHKMEGGSGQQTDNNFLRTLCKLRGKYHKYTGTIYTPCYIVPTAFIPFVLKAGKTAIKNLIR